MLGTFLVRSGVLVSVHSFAADPKRGLFILAFLVPIVILVAILVYLPAADTLRASFTNQNLRLANKPIEWVGSANYEKLLGDDEFWEVTLRSLFLVLIVVPLEIVLAFGAALLLNEQFRGRTLEQVRQAILDELSETRERLNQGMVDAISVAQQLLPQVPLTMDETARDGLWRKIGDLAFANMLSVHLFYLPAEAVVDPKVVESWVFPGDITGSWTHVTNIKAAR